MSGPGFQSDAAAMTQAVAGFDQAAQNTHTTIKALEAELLSGLNRYEGNQARAFWQLYNQIQDDVKIASRELDTLSSLVNQSFRNYGTGDESVASDLTSVANATSGAHADVLGRLSGRA